MAEGNRDFEMRSCDFVFIVVLFLVIKIGKEYNYLCRDEWE